MLLYFLSPIMALWLVENIHVKKIFMQKIATISANWEWNQAHYKLDSWQFGPFFQTDILPCFPNLFCWLSFISGYN